MDYMVNSAKKIFLEFVLFLFGANLHAEITLPAIIGDNMILQQHTEVNLWGWAPPGEIIIVNTSWNNCNYTSKVGDDGEWRVAVKTPKGSYVQHSLTFSTDSEKVVVHNVLIGEVWLASGQSNMEMPLRGYYGCPVEGAMAEITESNRYKGRIRFVNMPRTEAYNPITQVKVSWKESSVENSAEFSAVAWFFAKSITEVLDVPVGIVCNAWGGSTLEGWLPREIVKGYSDKVSTPERIKIIQSQMARPTIMYYGQWTPIRLFTFRGVIWYQGESNIGSSDYAIRMRDLITLWRKESGNASLPVYQVGIAPYVSRGGKDGLESALLREQQSLSAREIDNCWCISTVDLVYPYESNQIHPAQKKEVGERLSYLAFNHTYGLLQFPGVAPSFKAMEVKDSVIYLTFDKVREAGGFNRTIGIEGFEICGEDKVWYDAEAWVQPSTDQIIVRSKNVFNPVNVRYCFKNWQRGNLLSAKGLAVEPFHTDVID